MLTLNRFDIIAPIYGPLVKLFFGQAHLKSQKIFFNEIPDASSILILGGGAGNVLIELLFLKPVCKICYIEASGKMILLAKKKCNNLDNIRFIHGTQENIPDQKFDVVITNFYFDLFKNDTLQSIIKKIDKSLQINSQWFITDFVDGGKWWRSITRFYPLWNLMLNLPSIHFGKNFINII